LRPAFCMPSSKKGCWQAFQLAQYFFSLSHFSDSGLPKISWGGEKSDNHFVQGQDHEKDSWTFPTMNCHLPILFLIMHTSRAFVNNQHHFLTFPSFFAPSPYISTICLWISTQQTFLTFKNSFTDCIPQVAWFLYLSSYLMTVVNGARTYETILCNTCVPFDIRKTTDLHSKCLHHLHGRYSLFILTLGIARHICIFCQLA